MAEYTWKKGDRITAERLNETGNELPPIGDSDAGKVLTVNDSHTGAEWKTPSGGSPTEHILFYNDRGNHYYVTPPTDAPTLPSGYEWEEDAEFGYYPVHADGTAYTADEVEAINIGDVIKTNSVEETAQTYNEYAIVVGKHYRLVDSAEEGYNASCILSFALTSPYGSNVYGFGFVFYGNQSNEEEPASA